VTRLAPPRRIGDQMVQGLMRTAHVVERQTCSHRLDALALSPQQQTRAVLHQRSLPVGMPRGLRQAIEVSRRAFLPGPGAPTRVPTKTILLQNVPLMAQQYLE
jgi:hypothetical protein